MKDALIITNGDVAAGIIRRRRIGREIAPWRDAQLDGPYEAEDCREELSALLEKHKRCREVVLWFGHDLHDQLQLLQLLHYFAAETADPARLSLIQAGRQLAQETASTIHRHLALKRPVTSGQLQLASRAWERFRAPTPAGWAALLGDDLAALPFLRAAILRSLEELPAPRTGLGRSELAALRAIANGARKRREVFAAAQEDEEAPFMDQEAFARLLDSLALPEAQLVEALGRGADPDPALVLTALGKDALAGRTDAAGRRRPDRWLGGTHLTSASLWRWDGATRTLIAP
jgi:hypothetical protein